MMHALNVWMSQCVQNGTACVELKWRNGCVQHHQSLNHHHICFAILQRRVSTALVYLLLISF